MLITRCTMTIANGALMFVLPARADLDVLAGDRAEGEQEEYKAETQKTGDFS